MTKEYFIVESMRTYSCIDLHREDIDGFVKGKTPESAMKTMLKKADTWCLSVEHLRNVHISGSDMNTGDKLDEMRAYADANAYHKKKKPLAVLEGDNLAALVEKELERRKRT